MEGADTSAAEANRLYWETELPVSEIAQRLDLSRRALYDAVRPVSAGGQCASCGGELEYTNRSARSHALATCARCGVERDLEAEPAWTWSPSAQPVAAPVVPPAPRSVWWLGAATLAGALTAAAITLLLVRDD